MPCMLIILSACAREKKVVLPFTVETKKRYFANRDTSHEIFIDYPVLNTKWKQQKEDAVNKFLYDEFVGSDSAANEYLGNYYEPEEDEEETTAEDDWYGRDEVGFVLEYKTSDYLCISKHWAGDYKGAAHASWSAQYYHINMRTGKRLKLSDIYKDEIFDALKPVILQEFGDKPKEFTDTLDLRNVDFDFYFTRGCKEECLHLYFAPYSSIGNYIGIGYIDIYLPIPTDVHLRYMKRKWRKRIFD